MKSKTSGHNIRSGAVVFVFMCGAISLISPVESHGGPKPVATPVWGVNPDVPQARGYSLTFADRVAYQRAIEEVYWRHRIWPRARHDPKPSLDAVMSQTQIEKKVKDYLRESQALEDHWQEPLTPDQLQAEMDRMARHTKQPAVLREIFQALRNDPFVIAECLARPILAQRLITDSTVVAGVPPAPRNSFAASTAASTEGGGSAYLKVATTDSNPKAYGVQMNRSYQLPATSNPSSTCIDDTWTATSTTNAPSARAAHTAVWTGSEMIIWGGQNNGSLNTGGKYNPSTDTWTFTSTTSAPSAREQHTAVWTGSDMIVWGGQNSGGVLNTGGRYDPGTDSWTPTGTNKAPSGRYHHTAVWADSEMIVWGGFDFSSNFNTGGRYNPDTDSWTATSTTNAPDARSNHTAVWAGSEMIVWGGSFCSPCMDFNTGGRYDPSTDTWVATSTSNAPSARFFHTAVWADSKMIVWGGVAFPDTLFNTGGRYDPGTDTWVATSISNAPSAREEHKAVGTDTKMIVWGGAVSGGQTNTGGRYDTATDSWTATSTINAPDPRANPTAVWTGSEMIVWGGAASGPTFFNTGGRYCAESGATPTPTATAMATPTATVSPTPRLAPTPRSRPTPAPRP